MRHRTAQELRRLGDKRLFEYFASFARYFVQNPPDSRYAIRLGSRHLFAEDTAELFEKFKTAVRTPRIASPKVAVRA